MNPSRVVLLAVGILTGAYAEGLGAQVPELTVTEIHRFPFQEVPFARVNRLREGPEGNLYVMEGGMYGVKGVLVFDREGHFVRQIGRGGEGPGEFRQLRAFGWHGDTLWILDDALQRVTTFDLDGEFLDSWQYDRPRGSWASSYSWTVRGVFPDQAVLFSEGAGISRVMELDSARLVAVHQGVGETRLIANWSPAGGFVRAPLSGGGEFQGLHPWPGSDLVVVASDRSQVLVVSRKDSDRYRVMLFDRRADTVYRTDVAVPPRRVSRADVRSWREQFSDRDGAYRQAIDEATEIPDYWPTATDVVVSGRGAIWVRRAPVEGSVRWDILDPRGRLSSFVNLPSSLNLEDVGDGVLWGIELDAFDVPHLVVVDLPGA